MVHWRDVTSTTVCVCFASFQVHGCFNLYAFVGGKYNDFLLVTLIDILNQSVCPQSYLGSQDMNGEHGDESEE